MNCLEFMRLRQSQGKLSEEMNLTDENIVIEEILPMHMDLFSLMFSHSINKGDITGNITSGIAVIGWTDRDGKIHTSNSDNHFIEGEKDG